MTTLFKLCRFASAHSLTVFNRCSKSKAVRSMPSNIRCFSDETKSIKDKYGAANTKNPMVRSQYVPISEETATIILDVEEEREKLRSGVAIENIEQTDENIIDQYHNLNTDRGVRGVFEIEDLVEVLKRDNAIDIFVCHVPSQIKYVDYLCVITARSPRHMKAIAEFVRKMYKLKRAENDLIPRLEGKGSTEWVALDMGNIALHIFSPEAREKYDIEQLWSVGAEFDAETNKPDDDVVQMFERHAIYLSDLTSAEQSADDGQSKSDASAP